MEPQQQPQQPIQLPQQIVPALTPPAPKEDFFRFRIESLDILEELQHQLRGEVLVAGKDGQATYEPKFDRWVNDEGINKILHIIYSCGINKNIFLGNLTHDQINLKCQYLKIKLAKLLFDKYKDYGIQKEMRSLIVETVKNQIHSGLSRCENGKEADQLSTAAQRHEIYHEGLPDKQGSIMNPLNWFGKKK